MRRVLLLWFAVLGLQYCHAQPIEKDNMLLKVPEFYKARLSVNDTLFMKDVAIIKGLIQLDTNATGLLRPPVLYDILKTEVDKGYPANYLTIKSYLEAFIQTPAYHDFIDGVALYKKFEQLYVTDDLWEEASQLFVQLGFTPADLEDFSLFLDSHKTNHWNYKQAYTSYLQEMSTYE